MLKSVLKEETKLAVVLIDIIVQYAQEFWVVTISRADGTPTMFLTTSKSKAIEVLRETLLQKIEQDSLKYLNFIWSIPEKFEKYFNVYEYRIYEFKCEKAKSEMCDTDLFNLAFRFQYQFHVQEPEYVLQKDYLQICSI